MKSHHLQEQYNEILRSDEWWEFENLSRLPIARQNYWKEAQKICRQFKELDCRFDVREMLKTHPFCACSFNLSRIRSWEKLPLILQELIDDGRESCRNALRSLSETLVPLIEQFSAQNKDNEFAEASLHLIKILEGSEAARFFDNNQLIILRKIFESDRGRLVRQRSEATLFAAEYTTQ